MKNIISKDNLKFAISFRKLCLLYVSLYFILTIALPESSITYLIHFTILPICLFYTITKTNGISFNKALLCLLFLALLFVVSYPMSNTEETIKSYYLMSAFHSFTLMFCLLNLIKDKNDFSLIIFSIIIGAILLSVNIYYTYGLEFLLNSGFRIDHSITNQNRMGIYFVYAIFFLMLRLITVKSNRIWGVLALLIVIPAMFFTGSRKAILMLLTAVIVYAFSIMDKQRILKSLKIILGVCVVIGVLALLIYYVPAFSVIRVRVEDTIHILFSNSSELNTSDAHRIEYIQKGFDEFLANPIIGNGFCHSYDVLGAYSHNNYIELLMNHGVVGLLLFYTPHFIILLKASRIRKYNKSIAAILFAITISILVCDIGVVTYYDTMITSLIAIMLVATHILEKNNIGSNSGS